MNRRRTLNLCLLLSCMLVVAVVRTLPRRLEGVTAAATERVRADIAKELDASADAAAVDRWINNHGDEYGQRLASLKSELKAELRFRADDGREHPYLGDYDSYLWIHQARNYLRHGTVCDEVVDGVCRDRLAHAPVGREMLYAQSLHTAAIVALHKVITLFEPRYPISSTAFFVVVLVGALGVIPAFFLGMLFGGRPGAVTAALVCSLSPVLLIRSVGSDNDVWNIVLPFYAVWGAVEALRADTPRRRFLCAGGAALAVALHAGTWSGWPLSHAIVTIGLGATLAFSSVRSALQRKTGRVWTDPAVRAIAGAFVAYFVAAGVAVTAVGSDVGFLDANLGTLTQSIGKLLPAGESTFDPDVDVWPKDFSAVAELLTLRQNNISLFETNVPFLFGAFVGIVLLALGRRPWDRGRWALLAGASAVVAYVYVNPPAAPSTAGILLFAPGLLAVGVGLASRDRDRDDLERGALMVIVWFVAAYSFGTRANRFVMFFAPPVGLAAAVVTGWAYDLIVDLVDRRVGHRLAVAAGSGVVVALLVTPSYRDYVTARDLLPKMNDAWWDTFAAIRDAAPPDAIVNLWWHDGHWAKYVTERPVIADGASLRAHISYWFRHALLEPDEVRAAGLLRMIDCGSDAVPFPEGRLGAYGKLRALGLSVLDAHDLVDRLAGESRVEAEQLLQSRGLDAAATASVLASTHCNPPPMYLVLGDDLATTAGWGNGLWDFRRAYVLELLRRSPREEALRTLVDDVGYTPAEARQLYRVAKSLRTEPERRDFVAPEIGFLGKSWIPCAPDSSGAFNHCPLESKVAGGGQVLDALEYSPGAPAGARLRIRQIGQTGEASYSYRTPGTIFVASSEEFRRIAVTRATDPALAVLIDLPGERFLMAEPVLLASTFTKLVFLDGRYLQHFERLSLRDSKMDDRVVSYLVRP